MTAQDAGFPAQLFEPKSPGGQAGLVLVVSAGLRFQNASRQLQIGWDKLKISQGGFNDTQLFFHDSSLPGLSIAVTDRKILEDPIFRASTGVPPPQRRRHHAIHLIWLVLLILLGLVLGLIVLIASQRDRLTRALADKLPVEWEIQLGNSIYENFRTDSRFQGPLTNPALSALFQQMTSAIPARVYPYQVHVLEDASVNAFAVPGGHIFVHTGLLKAAGRPEQIIGVLGHEVAHVTERHAFRNLIQAAGLALVLQAVLGDVGGLGALISESSELLLRQKYSRDFEREADDKGWDYLMAADIDPSGMLEFFQQLQKQEGTAGALKFLQTHPPTKERIARLQSKQKKLAASRGKD